MSNSKELSEYIMDQLSDLGDIRNIPMMGGYIFYYRESLQKIVTKKNSELPERKQKKKKK